MTLVRSEIRKDILERLCEKCGKSISEDVDFFLSIGVRLLCFMMNVKILLKIWEVYKWEKWLIMS